MMPWPAGENYVIYTVSYKLISNTQRNVAEYDQIQSGGLVLSNFLKR